MRERIIEKQWCPVLGSKPEPSRDTVLKWKVQHRESPKRSVAEAQAPARATLLGQEPHFQEDRSNVLGSNKGHLDHTSVEEALLFLCVSRHAPADANISLPGRTYKYLLNNLTRRDEILKPVE